MADEKKYGLSSWVVDAAEAAYSVADAVDIKSPRNLEAMPANTPLAKKLSGTDFEALMPMLFPQYLVEKTTIELSMARQTYAEQGGSFGISIMHVPLSLSYQTRYRDALATSDQMTVHIERFHSTLNKP